MSTEAQWAEQVRGQLVDSGVEPREAQHLADEFVSEAQGAGQHPADLFGPVVTYAATVALALRGTVTQDAPLDAVRGDVVLRLTNVTKRYRRQSVLSGVDLTVRAGEVAAVVGANGSGKSTLLNICAGIVKATSGTVERTPRVGYAPQQYGVSPLLTAAEHFRLFGAAQGVDRRRSLSTGEQLARRLGWAPRSGVIAGQLSGGTQQKLNVVLSQLGSPELILLDEPYQGFDRDTYVDFWDQVFKWREAGAGVLVVTHLLHDVQRVDQVVQLTRAGEA